MTDKERREKTLAIRTRVEQKMKDIVEYLEENHAETATEVMMWICEDERLKGDKLLALEAVRKFMPYIDVEEIKEDIYLLC